MSDNGIGNVKSILKNSPTAPSAFEERIEKDELKENKHIIEAEEGFEESIEHIDKPLLDNNPESADEEKDDAADPLAASSSGKKKKKRTNRKPKKKKSSAYLAEYVSKEALQEVLQVHSVSIAGSGDRCMDTKRKDSKFDLVNDEIEDVAAKALIMPRHDMFQADTSVTLSVYSKGIAESMINIDFQKDSVCPEHSNTIDLAGFRRMQFSSVIFYFIRRVHCAGSMQL